MSSRSVPLRPSPGEELVVALGGEGIEITGQLAVENQPANFDYHFSISYLVAKRPGIDPPASLADKGFDWRKGWSDAWRNSIEGGMYLNTLHSWFVKPTPEGRIRVSGVAPGEYELAINLFGSTEGCLVHPIASRVVPLTVKPGGDGHMDLGTLSIPSMTLPKIGDAAPDIQFTVLGGSDVSLHSYRGKYVLLDFWATWCGPCVAKLDEVDRLRRQSTAANDLVIIGMNLDADSERAKELLNTKDLPWKHALLGDWSATDVPRRFAIASVPSYVLVDTEGRIVAHEYSLEPIASKLADLGFK